MKKFTIMVLLLLLVGCACNTPQTKNQVVIRPYINDMDLSIYDGAQVAQIEWIDSTYELHITFADGRALIVDVYKYVPYGQSVNPY